MSEPLSSNPLVSRLRTLAKGCAGVEGFDEEVACYTQAASEIERLTAENAAMRRKMQESPGAADETDACRCCHGSRLTFAGELIEHARVTCPACLYTYERPADELVSNIVCDPDWRAAQEAVPCGFDCGWGHLCHLRLGHEGSHKSSKGQR